MRMLIVGLGSIGRRHLDNLRCLVPDAHISVWRRPVTAGEDLPQGADAVVHDAEQALGGEPDIALVTGPASQHVDVALALARKGTHLFIEKPLARSLAGVDELVACCRAQSLTLMVGYNLRFDRALRAVRDSLAGGGIGRVLAVRAEVGQYLPDWRPGRDYRQSVSAREELGGGAVLELSHELDYVPWLVGAVESVYACVGQVGELELEVEDMAEIILQFRDGAVGNIHLDMVQRAPVRTCRVIGSEGTVVWDGVASKATQYSAQDGTWSDLSAGSEDRNDMYIEELRHFLRCVERSEVPACTGEEGLRALQLALAVKESAQTRRRVVL